MEDVLPRNFTPDPHMNRVSLTLRAMTHCGKVNMRVGERLASKIYLAPQLHRIFCDMYDTRDTSYKSPLGHVASAYFGAALKLAELAQDHTVDDRITSLDDVYRCIIRHGLTRQRITDLADICLALSLRMDTICTRLLAQQEYEMEKERNLTEALGRMEYQILQDWPCFDDIRDDVNKYQCGTYGVEDGKLRERAQARAAYAAEEARVAEAAKKAAQG